MPGKVKVKVLAGRNLPVMDRASDTTDAFVEIKFGGVTHKTDVCRKSLNPHWNNTEWYRFEVDESELQDEPLQLRLMDHDTYSANDAIGKVVISLAPLLAREVANNVKGNAAQQPGAVMSGWIPVFDTMHGIRGELNVIIKVELFSDFNKYKTSSCGVQFFHCPTIPPGYKTTAIHGFVEELVVNDDPEYQWIDKIRTPRASNEARQVAFINLSNQVQRLVGLKAAELGANAVIGYQQDFDLEGEAGVVARAIGTAVSITALPTPSQPLTMPPCSQQQLKKYLDILSTDNENVTDLNDYFQTHQEELHKLMNILHPKYSSNFLDDNDNDDDEQSMNLTRQSSFKSYTDNVSIYQDDYISQKSFRTLSKDQTDLNKLLNRNYDDSDSDSSGPLQKIKKIKTNFFTKRLGSLRSKRNDKNDDAISIKSNSSDNSRISLTDIKNELKKFKRIKKPKFRKAFKNMEDEGVGMALILARSVIHAHTSLACIAETQDSEHSPSSTLRRTSESEPTINMTDDDKPQPHIITEAIDENQEIDPKLLTERRTSSLKNLSNIEADNDLSIVHRKSSSSCPSTPMSKRSENLLKLPGEVEYYGSLSSALSGESSEIYTTSEDDESSDLKTDTDRSFETTNSLVHNVLNKVVDSSVKAQIERKLSALECSSPEVQETKQTMEAENKTTEKNDRDKEKEKGSPPHTRHESYGKEPAVSSSGAAQNSSLNATSPPVGMLRRSSDSDLSITPKGSSLNTSGNAGTGGGAILRPSMNSNNIDLLEYPFLTMTEYPTGFIVHIGGCVCARSVKLIDSGGSEAHVRAAWWAELRTELRAHARALRCHVVLAYSETASICEDVCVLSASGTAAVINLDCDFNADLESLLVQNGSRNTLDEPECEKICSIAHVPYSPGPGPHGAELSHCGGCRRARVPSVLLATCSKPHRLISYGKGVTLTAVAGRPRRTPPQSEPGARDLSDQLPFLEYELHKLLLAKLRMQGANALFNLKTQIAIGERCVMALASGTAVRLAALPAPTLPRIKASEHDKDALEIQRALWDTFSANKTANGYDTVPELSISNIVTVAETEEPPVLELCADKETALLELDEAEDVETAKSLASRRKSMQVFMRGDKALAGVPPQAFAQIWRARFNLTLLGVTSLAERHIARTIDGVAYKLRRLRPCALLQPSFQLELSEDEIQIVISGAVIQLQDPNKPEHTNGNHDNTNNNHQDPGHHQSNQQGQGHHNGDGDDDIFTMDEEQAQKCEAFDDRNIVNGHTPTTVSLTSLSEMAGARSVRRVCSLRLLFVRETTSVRELGGLSGFLHTFTCEVFAIVRAYTAALSGNALTSFYVTQLMLQDNAHKNQGQCLLSVGGDVVHITY